MRTQNRKAFTLIELLTVIAITGILLTLIIVPVVQSFNMTRSAQAWSDAQNRARVLLERMSREITNAAGVRDNSGLAGTFMVEVPGRPASLGGSGGLVQVPMPYAKLDIVKPAEGEPEIDPATGDFVFRDPVTGRIDPTLRAPKGQVVLPVAPGSTYVRYFIGLRDPFRNYTNPYDAYGGWLIRSGLRDNLYVLWRAEYQPIIWDRNLNQFRANLDLFVDANNDGRPDDIDDPLFFTPNRDGAGNIITNDAKARRIQSWLSRATVVTEISRYDMIRPVFDRRTRVPDWDAANPNAPRLLSLVQFRPTRMTSESAEGMVALRPGEESENMEAIAPDVYRTRFADWTNLVVRTWPTGFDPTGDPDADKYLIARRNPAGDLGIFVFDPDLGTEVNSGTEVFNISEYQRLLNNNAPYP
ncbi:MAG TPA: type II secretion system protein, partial [Fimbriimonadaceae bacterium]|nr:type II secretion system protein [Fimbriimonadaceae bacterium]